MTRPARAACLLAAAWLAACGDDPVADGELTIDAPLGTAEQVPGGTTALAWTWTGAPAELTIALAPLGGGDPAITLHAASIDAGAGSFTWDGRDAAGDLVPPDVYDLHLTVRDGDAVLADQVRSLAVHGMTFTSPAPGETLVIRGSEVPTHVRIRTVSQRVISLVFALDPDPDGAADGDELPFDERSIPGEFVPFDRSIDFDGLDLDGAALPAGAYTIVVDVSDLDSDLAYRAIGGTVDWRPGE